MCAKQADPLAGKVEKIITWRWKERASRDGGRGGEKKERKKKDDDSAIEGTCVCVCDVVHVDHIHNTYTHIHTHTVDEGKPPSDVRHSHTHHGSIVL